MAEPNGRGGWDLTDADVAEIYAVSWPDLPPVITSEWVSPDFHLAVCENCRPVLPVPFHDPADRDIWTRKHAGATGHTVVRVDGVPR